ncbi:uncharacterized protein LOC132732832 [Ruditapes philippinarum]|uniref:uncharacterized protein LOC132732832 n=1 Tax=Ruditapes philippinarum TaxID=129788 RepID=UPI00295B9F62|nr:uncharacterized protein LOC132732832 [Ruditapes philippinarum]XP_060575330.1 uncharacterized protein LOC132732832 [Ruditapes philippinarum]XP_060575331.1 uncharacterized protein LOC132732832 [Ruditapes philippinarum]
MGNSNSVPEWTFVGREKDIKHVKKLLPEKKSILIFGLPKIGKTKFTEQIYTQLKDNKKCIWKDFELDDIDDGDDVYELFIEFLTEIDAVEEKSRFEKKFSSKFNECGTCDKCKSPGPDLCSQKDKMIKKAIDTIIATLKKDGKEIVLFFDNVDKVMNSSLKDNFLHFLRQSVNQTNLRTVIASGIKPKLTAKGFESYELNPLNDQAIRKILYEICECSELCPENDEEALHKVKYSSECLVFKPENEPYIDVIVKLCEGLPLAATMSGLLLTEDKGLLKPGDLVEILICMRLTALSPDNCPPEDRLNIYKRSMEEVKGVVSFFNALNEGLDGTTFSIDTAVSVAINAQEGIDTEAMAKLKVLKTALDRSILSIEKLSGHHQLTWHGMLRESQADLLILNTLPPDESVSKAKEMVLKFMKENLLKTGLDFDDDILQDPKSLELAIKNLSIHTPVQAQDVKRQLSLSEEHNEASKEFADDLKITVVKDVKDKEVDIDLETNPDMDSKCSKKLESRYSVSEDNELEFEMRYCRTSENSLINIHRANISGTEQIADNPPPYTTLPLETSGASGFNKENDMNKHLFESIDSPPPSYHSSTEDIPNNEMHHQDNNRNDQYHLQNIPTATIRSHSLSQSHNVMNDLQLLQVGREDAQQDIDSQRFSNGVRRTKSDPTSDRPTGPPAKKYSPPNVDNNPQIVNRHNTKTGLFGSHTSEVTSTNADEQIKYLKEHQELQTPDEVSAGIYGDSTVGPEAISYRVNTVNDLKFDQGHRQDENASLAQSYNKHDQMCVDGDSSQNVSHENKNRLLVETVSQRLSPTAIVKPMPRRNSPPNINKQTLSERPVQSVTPFR